MVRWSCGASDSGSDVKVVDACGGGGGGSGAGLLLSCVFYIVSH